MLSGVPCVLSRGSLCHFLVSLEENLQSLNERKGTTVTLAPSVTLEAYLDLTHRMLAIHKDATAGCLAYKDTIETDFYHVSVVPRHSKFPPLSFQGVKQFTVWCIVLKVYGHSAIATVGPVR